MRNIDSPLLLSEHAWPTFLLAPAQLQPGHMHSMTLAILSLQMQQMQRELQEQSSKSMRAIAQKERMESLARALREEMQQLKAEPQQAPSQPHENGISKSDTFVTSAA